MAINPKSIAGVDASTVRKFRRGELVDTRLDLHGLYRDAARDAVIAAVERAYATGWRCLLIITGKGQVLRPALNDWLSEVKPRILAVAPAQMEHGGAGAFYVLVRRNRERDDDNGEDDGI